MAFLVVPVVFVAILIELFKASLANRRLSLRILAVVALIFLIAIPIFCWKSEVIAHVTIFLEHELGILGTIFSDPVRAIDISRQQRLVGETAILPQLRIASYRDLILFFPLSLIIGLFYPLPWQANSWMSLAAIPEMIIWYSTFPFFIKGVFLSFKHYRKHMSALSIILLFIFLFFIFLPLHEGNAGALFRHRGMILPFLFMFISAGIYSRTLSTQLSRN